MVSLTPPVKKITTTVICHISSFSQYSPLILSHDKPKSLFSFTKVNIILSGLRGKSICFIYSFIFYCFITSRSFGIISLAMVNAKKTSFMVMQVANNGMAMGAAFMRILELEKEVSRLRYHMSVLSKRLNEKGEEKRV